MVLRHSLGQLGARCWLIALTSALACMANSAVAESAKGKDGSSTVSLGSKLVIGATATVEEVKTDLLFKARVDTGATTSSLHVEDYVIENEAARMVDNVGKNIRFRIKNHDGESEWLKSKIAYVTVIKTSADLEKRYKVHLTLRLHEVQKRVLVTLNDRSQMKYPMLLGRNFLRGDFIVDVDSKKNRAAKASPAAQQNPVADKPKKTVTDKKVST
jgi:hypothetical protein